MSTQSNDPAAVKELIDLEQFAKADRRPPSHQRYRIRIDKTHYEVDVSAMTGREILALAGKTPESHMLSQKLRGGQSIPIEANQTVDFTTPGIERFQTLALDPTEG
ncbi:MAG: multiubiquitin domain-containing protein [Planctomycetes bacterium]|nr:multiubiquitin domain-containing protein [Planctomycetota bacterium]